MFQRPVSAIERRLSYLLLALLPVIAAAIYLKGQRYDPAVFALDEAALEEPASGAASRGLPRDGLAFEAPAAGWRADGAVETITAATLYEKIDGRADEYLKHGARGLQFVSFTNDRQFVDVFVYDMGTPAQAAALLALERPPQPASLELADEAYRADASAFFRSDRYYVQVVASESGSDLEDIGLTLAKRVAAAIRAAGQGRD